MLELLVEEASGNRGHARLTPVLPPNEQLATDLTFCRDPISAAAPTPDSKVSDAWAQQKIVIP